MITVRNLRLYSGLLLFIFVLGHLINLGIGLVSIEAMDNARQVLNYPWSNIVGATLLGLSMLVHMVLGVWALYQRNTLKLNVFDAMQLLLGLALPVFLLPHFIIMIAGPIVTDVHMSYREVLTMYWVMAPALGLNQVIATMIVWVHACMGFYIWLRLMPWWGRCAPYVNAAMVVIPVLALLGFSSAGRVVVDEHSDSSTSTQSGTPVYATSGAYGSGPYVSDTAVDSYGDSGSSTGDVTASSGYGDESSTLVMSKGMPMDVVPHAFNARWWYLGIILLVLALRSLRTRGRSEPFSLKYVNGPSVEADHGLSVLEVSRANNVPHASLCSAKGRCGTCQVYIRGGEEFLSPMSELERATLEKFGAGDGVRLGCKVTVNGGPVVVERRYPVYIGPESSPGSLARAARRKGEEVSA